MTTSTSFLGRVSRRRLTQFMALSSVVYSVPGLSALHIDITGVGANQIPVAIAIQEPANVPQHLKDILISDLQRSGAFRVTDVSHLGSIENLNSPAILPEVAKMDVNALIAIQVQEIAEQRWAVFFFLYDVVTGVVLDSVRVTLNTSVLRMMGHRLADRVYTRMTGEGPMFASKLAYVAQMSPKHYQLIVADSDGENQAVALESPEPIISPVWSPDGQSLAYVSFEKKKPIVFVHRLDTGIRHAVAAYPGNNSAPAFSPDGTRLAVALSRDGLTQIYRIDLATKSLKRLTRSYGIDTEPVYSKDGKYLYFTSDRGGAPQIYRQELRGSSRAQRVTFGSNYAISPDISPDGMRMAYVSRLDGRFRIAVMDLATGQDLLVTMTERDRSPSFAPNGRFLVYATEVGGRGILGTCSADARLTTQLSGQGDIREPSWGPILQ